MCFLTLKDCYTIWSRTLFFKLFCFGFTLNVHLLETPVFLFPLNSIFFQVGLTALASQKVQFEEAQQHTW